MGGTRLLLTLLVLALVSISLVVAVVVRRDGADWPAPAIIALYALSFGQTGLAAIWMAFGKAPLPWRLLALVLVTVGWSLMLPREQVTTWNVALLSESLGIVALLSLLRLEGWRLILSGSCRSIETTDSSRQSLQFSISYLLAWTTSAAMILGILQYTFAYDALPTAFRVWRDIGWLAAGQTALAVAAIGAALGFHRAWARLAMLTMGSIACLASFGIVSPGPPSANLVLCCLELLGLLAVMAVVRVAGYRLWRTRLAEKLLADK
ncbi:MAG: hypothetical protein GXY83_41145 [Rhodopirellula sp.]|nr:hypothetical protein [Rhodopirellula sp.]